MSEQVKLVGDIMLRVGREIFPRGYLKDVYAWEDGGEYTFAWVMEPEKLARFLRSDNKLVPGEAVLVPRGPYLTRVLRDVGIKYDAFDYERGSISIYTLLTHMANSLWSLPALEGASGFDATIIPLPGYPWPHTYYSSKKGKVIKPKRPSWLLPENIVDEGHHIDSPGVNLCKLIEPLYPSDYEMGFQAVEFGAGKSDFLIVTHAMGSMDNVTRAGSWDDNVKMVNDCGGLLFPSLAVGPIPAPNFGPFVLVADVGMVLRGLKPYREKGTPLPSYTYDTDVWSMTTGSFFREAAISAFDQLTGRDDYISYLDLNVWPLGTPQSPELHGPGIADRLSTYAQLKREVRARMRIYKRDLDPDEMAAAFEAVQGTKHRYPYLESKVNAPVEMNSFPLAVAPAQAADGFRAFLRDTGFKGRLLTVDLPDEIADVMRSDWSPEGMDWDQRSVIQAWAHKEYAWHVSDVIMANAEVMAT
jgi:hypothetical protein